MATNFPTGLDIFPVIQPTDDTKTISHSAQHNNVADAIVAIETKLGVNNSTDTTSIDYLLKNPNSVNPGHKHTLAGALTDVVLTSPVAGQTLRFNGTSWVNVNGIFKSGTPVANQIAVFVDEETIGGFDDLTFDNTNKILSVPKLYRSVIYDNGLITLTSYTIDWNKGDIQKITLGANITLSFTNAIANKTLVLEIIQDATGGRTITWPTTVKWAGGTAPALSTGANKIDIIVFWSDGTNQFGSIYGLGY